MPSGARSTASGLSQLRFHDLRHTFGTQAVAKGATLVQVQAWMGHADIQTTMAYHDYAPCDDEADLVTGPSRPSRDGRLGRRYGSGMTAKDKLRSFVDELSEAEAAAALDFLVARRGDALTQLLETAPIDDEPTTPEEEALVQEARDALARGEPRRDPHRARVTDGWRVELTRPAERDFRRLDRRSGNG